MATILITGANRGIGLELARAYVARGDTVIGCCRNPDAASELNATGAEVMALDVGSDESVSALKAELGARAMDVVINNAGVGDSAGFGGLSSERFADVLNVNTIGPMRVLEALVDNLAAGDRKLCANISSQMGSIAQTTAGFGLIYRTSKAGLNMALKAASMTLADRDISLLTLHPGWVATDMGGAQAPVTPANSAAGLIRVIDANGQPGKLLFLDWQGREIAW